MNSFLKKKIYIKLFEQPNTLYAARIFLIIEVAQNSYPLHTFIASYTMKWAIYKADGMAFARIALKFIQQCV